ncbi:dnaJ homolog subfamily C member 24-like [Chelonus insularis]|uniref:dnaJ homolog subfamily C member 24-like n=1 Tax=Chelonus insularis TaxID=460826 RepID=UPI00158AAC38|nr:dnaJ homolog subfamily C member 24-like [Chelonus insularis]
MSNECISIKCATTETSVLQKMALEQNLYKYYEVLGCNKESSYEELRQAYKKMALLYHPDKYPQDKNNLTNDKFLAIEEAWRILSDNETRKKYDAECRQAELESENILIYDNINLDQLKEKDDKFLSYPCRCGSNYLISKSDINEDSNEVTYIPCQECTFCIVLEK